MTTSSLPDVAPTKIVALGTSAAITDAVAACVRSTAERHSRLSISWLELMTQSPELAAWSVAAVRLTVETNFNNVEHCQTRAFRMMGGSK